MNPLFRFLRWRPVRALFLALAPVFEWPMRAYFGVKAIVSEETPRAGAPTEFDALAEDAETKALVADTERRLARTSAGAQQRFFLWAEERADQDEHGLAYAERTFEWMRQEIERRKGPLAGLRVLELGPGQTLASGLLLHAHGVAKYTAVDMFFLPGRKAHVYRRLREHLAKRPLLLPLAADAAREEALRRFDAAIRLDGEEASFDPTRVEYCWPVDAAKLPFPAGSFDVVLSLAAFEHFKDPLAAIKECARVTAADGVNLHQIDLRDHRDFAKPLEFLKHGDDEWQRLAAGQPSYTNRWRKDDFARAFVEAGFAVTDAQVNARASLDAALRASLDARFRDRAGDDLEAVSVFFALRRSPADAPASPHRSTAGTTPRA